MKPETGGFLGAGASRALGLPLTDDILPGDPLTGSVRHTLFGDDESSRTSLRRCLTALLPGLNVNAAPRRRHHDQGVPADYGHHLVDRPPAANVRTRRCPIS